MSARLVLTTVWVIGLFGCRGCDGGVNRIAPLIGVRPVSLDFGPVKAGTEEVLTLEISAQSKAALEVSGVTLAEGSAPGGAAAFEVLEVPTVIDSLSTHPMKVKFRPSALLAYEAVLHIASNDEEHPDVSVLLSGEGATPKLEVTPECRTDKKCTGSAVVDPPSIDFGPEPFVRLLPLPVTALPTVAIVNAGEVDLVVTRLAFEGLDAAAFSIEGNAALPAGGERLGPSEGRNLSLEFKPTSEQQTSYQAELVIESDDQARPVVRVALTGTLRANLPPVVCANITRVVPGDGSAPVDFNTAQDWAPLLVPPSGGYDFTTTRDIRPKSEVTFSALSDPLDETACTADPEDGRSGLAFEWKVLSAPSAAAGLTLGGATTSQATLRPKAGSGLPTGEYVVELSARDVQGHLTATTLKFVVALKEDLVVQLSWQGFAAVDLDLHLVRPTSTAANDLFSGAFSFFEEAPTARTSGDLNGWSYLVQQNNAGFDFEWGATGTADDPRLNLDDTGTGQLLENISLNYPENDPRCASAPCSYKVLVHYFRDARASIPPACTVTGAAPCVDGSPCDCAAGTACVANSAPIGSAPTGAGKCFVPPQPVVRIFFKGSATAAAEIPLPSEVLPLGAPCQLLYVADVVWPAKSVADAGVGGAPQVMVQSTPASPQVARYGFRQANSTQCSPNVTKAAIDWYGPEP